MVTPSQAIGLAFHLATTPLQTPPVTRWTSPPGDWRAMSSYTVATAPSALKINGRWRREGFTALLQARTHTSGMPQVAHTLDQGIDEFMCARRFFNGRNMPSFNATDVVHYWTPLRANCHLTEPNPAAANQVIKSVARSIVTIDELIQGTSLTTSPPAPHSSWLPEIHHPDLSGLHPLDGISYFYDQHPQEVKYTGLFLLLGITAFMTYRQVRSRYNMIQFGLNMGRGEVRRQLQQSEATLAAQYEKLAEITSYAANNDARLNNLIQAFITVQLQERNALYSQLRTLGFKDQDLKRIFQSSETILDGAAQRFCASKNVDELVQTLSIYQQQFIRDRETAYSELVRLSPLDGTEGAAPTSLIK